MPKLSFNARFSHPRTKVQLGCAPSEVAALPNGVTVAHVGNKTIVFAGAGVTGGDFVNANLTSDQAAQKKKRKPSMDEKKLRMADFYMDASDHLGHPPKETLGTRWKRQPLTSAKSSRRFTRIKPFQKI